MKRILLLVIPILLLTEGKGQCILSLRNNSDSTITINIDRLDVTHTLAPKELYTYPKVIPQLYKCETYGIVYDGITTTCVGSLDSGKYTKGRYEFSFEFSPKFRLWEGTIRELKVK